MTRLGVIGIVYSMFQLGQVGEEGQIYRLYPLILCKLWSLPVIDQDQIYSTASEVALYSSCTLGQCNVYMTKRLNLR